MYYYWLLCTTTVYYYCVLLLCTTTVYYYWLLCTTTVYYYCVLLLCTTTVSTSLLLLCTTTDYCVLLLCTTTVYYYCVQLLCTSTVYFYCVLLLCTTADYCVLLEMSYWCCREVWLVEVVWHHNRETFTLTAIVKINIYIIMWKFLAHCNCNWPISCSIQRRLIPSRTWDYSDIISRLCIVVLFVLFWLMLMKCQNSANSAAMNGWLGNISRGSHMRRRRSTFAGCQTKKFKTGKSRPVTVIQKIQILFRWIIFVWKGWCFMPGLNLEDLSRST